MSTGKHEYLHCCGVKMGEILYGGDVKRLVKLLAIPYEPQASKVDGNAVSRYKRIR